MLATATSFWITGIEARRVEVEAQAADGTPAFTVVGMADRAVQEARQRVRSGIVSSSYEFPDGRVTVNLAPARERKEGSGFDLAMALPVVAAHDLYEAVAILAGRADPPPLPPPAPAVPAAAPDLCEVRGQAAA